MLTDHGQGTAARPLRVLQVPPRFFPDLGGVESHVHEISRRLARRDDIEVTIATTDRTRQLPREELTEDGVLVLRRTAWPRERDYYLAPGLAEVIRTGDWDVVHVQGIHTAVPVIAMNAARRAGIPYVVTFHTGGQSIGYRNRIRSLQWRALAPLLRGAAKLVAVGRFEERVFAAATGAPADRFAVIRNGGALPEPPGEVAVVPGRVVSSGRLERYKGHHRAIEALPHLRRLDPAAHLHILGAGTYEAELRALAGRLGVADAVTIRFVQPGDRVGMARALAEASVVAAFSDYEAHPVAVMEALTLGVPVVGYDVAGIGDLVEDGLVTGLRPGSSPEQAAQALHDAMTAGRVAVPPSIPTWDEAAEALARIYLGIGRRDPQPHAVRS